MLIRNYLNIPFKDSNFDHINKKINMLLFQKFNNDGSKINKIVIDNDYLPQIKNYTIDKDQLIDIYIIKFFLFQKSILIILLQYRKFL